MPTVQPDLFEPTPQQLDLFTADPSQPDATLFPIHPRLPSIHRLLARVEFLTMINFQRAPTLLSNQR